MDNTERKEDIMSLIAIVQRDRSSYAIVPHIPGGIADVATLRKICDVAEKYNCKALKLTSAQRIALVGIPEEQLESAWADLGMAKGQAIGNSVRSVKICPGTIFCKRAKQDSVTLGLELDKKYHGMELPCKLKIGVSGCSNCCAESNIKDIGIIGTVNGFSILIGGFAAGKGRLADLIYQEKSPEETLQIVDKIIETYKAVGRKGVRLGMMIKRIGPEIFVRALEAEGPEREKIYEEIRIKSDPANK